MQPKPAISPCHGRLHPGSSWPPFAPTGPSRTRCTGNWTYRSAKMPPETARITAPPISPSCAAAPSTSHAGTLPRIRDFPAARGRIRRCCGLRRKGRGADVLVFSIEFRIATEAVFGMVTRSLCIPAGSFEASHWEKRAEWAARCLSCEKAAPAASISPAPAVADTGHSGRPKAAPRLGAASKFAVVCNLCVVQPTRSIERAARVSSRKAPR